MTTTDAMPQMRVCRRCKTPRPMPMFYLAMEARKTAKIGAPWTHHCRECNREVALLRRRPRVDYCNRVKTESGCTDCGIRSDHPEIYDFDHLPGVEKSGGAAQFLTKGTMQDLIDEIAKCEVVCANCHRIRTRSRVSPAFGVDRGAEKGRR